MDRLQQLLIGAGEAAMNAVVHGGGGVAALATDGQGTVQVRLQDVGVCTPRDGSGRTAPGYGWWLIARSVDRVWIFVGEGGTTVVLEQDRTTLDARLDLDTETDRNGLAA
jgi:anti-sigma regulatory factor (Ser/Thr protein kinase)